MSGFTRKELHLLVIDVEFVLISVVQGVALTTLAVEAAPILHAHQPITWVFATTGLLFILSFWSIALIHAISFLTWPMDLIHYFFYFAIALLECLMFAQMERPQDWFAFSLAYFVTGWILYLYDYRLIQRRRAGHDATTAQRALFQHIVRSHRFEMLVLVPAGLVFTLIACVLASRNPETALPLAVLQLLLMLE